MTVSLGSVYGDVSLRPITTVEASENACFCDLLSALCYIDETDRPNCGEIFILVATLAASSTTVTRTITTCVDR